MSDYLYFPNNLKDIKDYIKLKNLFPINCNSFQIKPTHLANFRVNCRKQA